MNDSTETRLENEANKRAHHSMGVALGLCFGTALGIVFGNIGLGTALGLIFGILFDSCAR